MENLIARAAEGQPLLVVTLIVAVWFLWRDLQKEREARVAVLREMLDVARANTAAIERLTASLTRKGE